MARVFLCKYVVVMRGLGYRTPFGILKGQISQIWPVSKLFARNEMIWLFLNDGVKFNVKIDLDLAALERAHRIFFSRQLDVVKM